MAPPCEIKFKIVTAFVRAYDHDSTILVRIENRDAAKWRLNQLILIAFLASRATAGPSGHSFSLPSIYVPMRTSVLDSSVYLAKEDEVERKVP